MPPIVSDALVLRTYELGETSKIALLLTRERGKVRAVAKGARGRRNRYQSALEPMSEVRVGLYGRQGAELMRLGECELLRSAYGAASRDAVASLTLGYCAELLECFVQEGQPDDDCFRLARAVVDAMEQGQSSAVTARYLETWLLRLGGLYPPLDACANCSRPLPGGALHYHHPAHGFCCDTCRPVSGPILSVTARRFLEECGRRPPSAVEAAAPADLAPFHQQLLSQHLERELKSFRVLRDVERGAGR